MDVRPGTLSTQRAKARPGRRAMQPFDLDGELERHHAAAFGWALSCCAWDRAAAEDALQASYLKVLDGRAVFRGESGFKTWLFAVIRRTAAEHRRRSVLARIVPLGHLLSRGADRDAASDPETALLQSEANERLVAALRTLPARQRDVLHLVFYQDLTIAGAARVLGISIGTARTHYERAKQRLRQLLGQEG